MIIKKTIERVMIRNIIKMIKELKRVGGGAAPLQTAPANLDGGFAPSNSPFPQKEIGWGGGPLPMCLRCYAILRLGWGTTAHVLEVLPNFTTGVGDHFPCAQGATQFYDWARTAVTTATTEEFIQSIQAPPSTHPGTSYPVRANPSLRLCRFLGDLLVKNGYMLIEIHVCYRF